MSQCRAMQCSAMQCSAVQCSVVYCRYLTGGWGVGLTLHTHRHTHRSALPRRRWLFQPVGAGPAARAAGAGGGPAG
jgi:hypothetical protein